MRPNLVTWKSSAGERSQITAGSEKTVGFAAAPAGPSPSPFGPWQGAQFCAKESVARPVTGGRAGTGTCCGSKGGGGTCAWRLPVVNVTKTAKIQDSSSGVQEDHLRYNRRLSDSLQNVQARIRGVENHQPTGSEVNLAHPNRPCPNQRAA